MQIDQALVDADYCYLTTTGRVTGEPHTVEIWFAIEGRALYVLAGSGRRADFVRNLLKSPDVPVRIAERRFRSHARIVSDAVEEERARRLVFEKYAVRTGDDLDEWRYAALAVAFDLEPG